MSDTYGHQSGAPFEEFSANAALNLPLRARFRSSESHVRLEHSRLSVLPCATILYELHATLEDDRRTVPVGLSTIVTLLPSIAE